MKLPQLFFDIYVEAFTDITSQLHTGLVQNTQANRGISRLYEACPMFYNPSCMIKSSKLTNLSRDISPRRTRPSSRRFHRTPSLEKYTSLPGTRTSHVRCILIGRELVLDLINHVTSSCLRMGSSRPHSALLYCIMCESCAFNAVTPQSTYWLDIVLVVPLLTAVIALIVDQVIYCYISIVVQLQAEYSNQSSFCSSCGFLQAFRGKSFRMHGSRARR